MEGATKPNDVTLEYCWQLIQEYSILQQSQIYCLLKRHAHLEKRARHRLVERLKEQWHIHTVEYNGEKYVAKLPHILPKDRYKKQIICFWILLDYFTQVDSHFAAGTFSRISMEIGGKDYDIVYVEKGQEQLCTAHIRKNCESLYIAVVEDTGQIPLMKCDKIRAFAAVNEYGSIEYYTVKE